MPRLGEGQGTQARGRVGGAEDGVEGLDEGEHGGAEACVGGWMCARGGLCMRVCA